jgi:hypothetical protein
MACREGSIDSVLHLLLEEFRNLETRFMAGIEGGLFYRASSSKLRTNRTVFDDLGGGPVFDSYPDDLGGGSVFDSYPEGDGPIFDGEPFVDPVIDATLDSDHAVVKSAKSVCVVRDQKTDDLTDGPVFDTNSAGLVDGLVFDVELVHDRVDVELTVFD